MALLLTGGLDETVRLCDPKNFTCIQTFTGHCLGIVSVAAHPTRRIAASTSIDSFIRVFEVDTNNTIATLEAPPSEVWQLQFSPNVSKELEMYSVLVQTFMHKVIVFTRFSSVWLETCMLVLREPLFITEKSSTFPFK